MDLSERNYFFDGEKLAVGECLVRYRHPTFGPGWLNFVEPSEIFATSDVGNVISKLTEVETAIQKSGNAVGFISYESSSAFDPNLPSPKPTKLPLLWFGVYPSAPRFFRELLPVYQWNRTEAIDAEWDLTAYAGRFDQVKDALGRGETYQVNLSYRLQLESKDGLFNRFRLVCGTQPPPYATYLQGEGWEIASFSPELFLKRSGETVTMIPMKGTRRETVSDLPDMPTDPKSMAENLMIVDMVRNDLGKIAEIGSVTTPKLFEVETHRTVKQMVSHVEAKTSASFSDLIAATFPPASVTGAPKVAACNKVFDLESSAREIYCGTIGMLQPNGDARFSVAIRTAWQTSEDSELRYGIGGGLVWDSVLEDEFEECLLKADILTCPAPQWELIECFHRDALNDPILLEDHWLRFHASAIALGVPIEKAIFQELLSPLAEKASELPVKIRVAARLDGTLSVSASNSTMPPDSLRATLARKPVSSQDPNMIHKTNSRQVLVQAMENEHGFDEVLLFNEHNEICEFSRGNVLVRLDGQWFTPEPGCGCLAGIAVKRLVRNGEATYRRITVSEARDSKTIRFINSIVGVLPVTMEWQG